MTGQSFASPPDVVSTGVPGLDDVMGGGFTRSRLFLLEGVPGSGKTTIALQFLIAAARRGEPVLYVSLSETADELAAGAASHGWSLDGITVRELAPAESELNADEQNTMFHPSEVELTSTTALVLADVQRLKPTCVVLDSLSELRLLAGTPLRHRRQILALKQYFATRNTTVLLLDDVTAVTAPELQMHTIAHGAITLEHMNPEYGSERRRLRISKYRGTNFRGGYHDYVIRRGGVQVFPRLVAAEHRQGGGRATMPSGLAGLDALLGGGIEEGTSTLIVGAAGTGKSTIAAQFVAAAAAAGHRGAMFLFDEGPGTLLTRCENLNVSLCEHVDSGRVVVQQVDPAELTPGELTQLIRNAVEEQDLRVVVLDSLNGYLNAMPGERFLTVQLHELLMYLSERRVVTILVGAHAGLIGGTMHTPVDASYLADSILLLRYFEARGEVRQAISVIKKRGGAHERTVRELRFNDGRIAVGDVLSRFRGILTGVPTEHPTGDWEGKTTSS